jgi:hypothetical protein
MKFKKGNQTNTLRLLINWLFVPLSVLIALILLYQLVLRPIPPASMEENIIGSTAIGFSNIYRAIGELLQLVLISPPSYLYWYRERRDDHARGFLRILPVLF